MKKILLFLAAALIGAAAFSQNVESNVSTKIDTLVVANTNAQQSQQLSRDIYMDMKSAIVSIAESLKVGADHVYTVLVKQQYINSWTYVMGWFGWLILLFVFVMCLKQLNNIDSNEDLWMSLSVVFGILTVIIGIICIAMVSNMITGFVNPEYNAIKEILKAVNK